MIALMFARASPSIPFIAPYNVANVGLAETDLPVIYFAGGADDARSPRRSSAGSPTATARSGCSRSSPLISIVPILVTTHLPPAAARRRSCAVAVLFFVFVTGPLRPGDGARHRQRRAARCAAAS